MPEKQKAGKGKKPSPNKEISAGNNRLPLLLSLIIAVTGLLLYINTSGHGYTLDDFSVIKDNNIVTQGKQGIPVILKTSYRYGYLSLNDGLYRPLSLVMFALEWEYFPGNPSAGHWVNIVLYALTGFLLCWLLCRLMRGYNAMIPFAASLLFIAHPIHTEIVASIKSRDELTCFLFFITSSHFLLNYVAGRSWIQLVLMLVSFFLALLAKETGVTMLIIFPLMLYFFTDLDIKRLLRISSLFLAPLAVYFFIRSRVLDTTVGVDAISSLDNSLLASKDIMVRLATAMKVLGAYLQLLIFPHPLICDRSFNHIPNVSWGDWKAILSLLTYLAMGIYALKNLPKRNLIAFGIVFYLISIALFSNLVFMIGSVMAERFVYFASLGFCIAVAALLSKLFKTDVRSPLRNISQLIVSNAKLMFVLGAVVVFYAFTTIDRNKVWKDNYTLYSNDVKQAPNSARIHYYLGRELIKEVAAAEKEVSRKNALYDEGIREMQKALEIAPFYTDAYSQMGLGYTRKGEREKAIACYLKALELDPNDPITLNNLGSEYFTKGMYKECIDIYKKVVTIDPRYADAMVNLGSCYGTLNDYDNAISWFNRAIQVDPNYARAYFFLSMTYRYKGDNATAEKYYDQAVRLDPSLKQQQK